MLKPLSKHRFGEKRNPFVPFVGLPLSRWVVAITFFCAKNLNALDTVGCQVHPDFGLTPRLTKLTEMTWTETISEMDAIASSFRLRILFAFVGFEGKGLGANDPYPHLSLTTQTTNSYGVFSADALISSFSAPGLPGIGLRLSSLQSTFPVSGHGVALNAPLDVFPQWARVFENTDGLGSIAKSVMSRRSLRSPTAASPIRVRWWIRRIEIVTNPQGQFAKNVSGQFVPLLGTFSRWKVVIDADGKVFDVADYFLPIEKAEFIYSHDPLALVPEHFGSVRSELDLQKSEIAFSDFWISDGSLWRAIRDWKITSCIDDQGGNKDLRYGWRSTTNALVDYTGHQEDVAQCTRTVGTTFRLADRADLGSLRVVSAASFSDPGRMAPRSLGAVLGKQLASQTIAASGSVFPTQLGGTQVRLLDARGRNSDCQLLFVSPTQINVLLADDPSPGLASLYVVRDGKDIAMGNVMISQSAPSIFTADSSGTGPPAATALRIRPDGTREDVFVFRCSNDSLSCEATSIQLASDANELMILTLYATGLQNFIGKTTASVRIGGLIAEVYYMGAQGQYAGLDQINIRLPPSLRGAGEVSLTVEADKLVSNAVTLRLQ